MPKIQSVKWNLEISVGFATNLAFVDQMFGLNLSILLEFDCFDHLKLN
jgi:hypothetical protein